MWLVIGSYLRASLYLDRLRRRLSSIYYNRDSSMGRNSMMIHLKNSLFHMRGRQSMSTPNNRIHTIDKSYYKKGCLLLVEPFVLFNYICLPRSDSQSHIENNNPMHYRICSLPNIYYSLHFLNNSHQDMPNNYYLSKFDKHYHYITCSCCLSYHSGFEKGICTNGRWSIVDNYMPSFCMCINK
jgi:hypothetical protein